MNIWWWLTFVAQTGALALRLVPAYIARKR